MPLVYPLWVSVSTPSTTFIQTHTTTANTSCPNQLLQITYDSGTSCSTPTNINQILLTQTQIKNIKLPVDWQGIIQFADGCVIEVDGLNYRILDDNAKITYQANHNRAFNRYLNASDLIEEFFAFIAGHGVVPEDGLAIPLELFVTFLIIRAAEADREAELVAADRQRLLTQVDEMKTSPRCKMCGKFIKHRNAKEKIYFCSGSHVEKYLLKIETGSP